MLLRENRDHSSGYGHAYNINSPAFEVQSSLDQTVELILVQVANQPFGLLMKQVYNIARPEANLFSVKSQPDPANGREWAEIFYQGKTLSVLELASKLHLTPAEPLDTSKILLSGQFVPGGTIQQPFGVSVDDIIGVCHIGLDHLRLLDDWVCRKRLGRLIWGVALVGRETLTHHNGSGELQPASPFSGIISETGPLPGQVQRNKNGRIAPAPTGSSGLEDRSRVKNNLPEEQPVMLLDLEILRATLYRS
jgi:chemotaxis signal transduction protein